MELDLQHLGINRGWRDAAGFVHIEYGVDAHATTKSFTAEDAWDGRKLVESLAGGGPIYMVADIRRIPRPTAEARRVDPDDAASVVAILVGNAVNRMLAYTYLQFTRPKHTNRVFTCEDKAVAWLREVRDERDSRTDG